MTDDEKPDVLPWQVQIDGEWVSPHSLAAELERVGVKRRALNLRMADGKHPGPAVWVGKDGPTRTPTRNVPAFFLTEEDDDE